MATYEPNHYNIMIQPIFVNADGGEFPFEGFNELTEYDFIAATLRLHFGNDLDFDEKTLIPGRMVIAQLSNAQMKILRGIWEDTGVVPVKYGRSRLKFELHGYVYDKPPCDQNCDCCECLGCCGYEKN